MMGQDIRPDGVVWVGRLGDDPEAKAGMVNDGQRFGAGWGDGPVLAEEVQGVIGVEAALFVEGQVEIQQWRDGHGQEAVALFLEA